MYEMILCGLSFQAHSLFQMACSNSFFLLGLGRAPVFFWFSGCALRGTQGGWRGEATLKCPGADTATLPGQSQETNQEAKLGGPQLPHMPPYRGSAHARNDQTEAIYPEVIW